MRNHDTLNKDLIFGRNEDFMISISEYPVPVLTGDFSHKTIHVKVPGSKSITNRALLLAMLSDGKSHLTGAQFSEDSSHFLQCLSDLSFDVASRPETGEVSVHGLSGRLPVKKASLYVGSAGTAARFLSAVLGVSEGEFFLDASEQMKKRPMAPLLSALQSVGCDISFAEKEGFFPFTLHARGFQNTDLTIDIDKSSQFLSALLIAAPLAKEDVKIKVAGTHGMAYIEMTCRMMEQFGVLTEHPSPDTFLIKAGQTYRAQDYAIEPDVSAACYFYALAALSGCSVIVDGVPEHSLQGDTEFLNILEKMGCRVTRTNEGICITGPAACAESAGVKSADAGSKTASHASGSASHASGSVSHASGSVSHVSGSVSHVSGSVSHASGRLHGLTVDMSSCSDQAITLAAIAPFADSPVTITGIGHIRGQESDRLSAITENLTAMGIRCDERADSITIYPGVPKPAHIKTHDDHRLAMGFAVTGLFAEGIVIENPSCCRKTFAEFFECLEEAVENLQK